MNKIIAKTAAKTILVLLALFMAINAVLSLAIPGQMASYFERTGNYSLAIQFANIKYGYTNDINDLSRIAEDAVYSQKSNLIIKYGEELVNHSQFEKLCISKDEQYSNGDLSKYTTNYKQFICGNLSVAYAKEDFNEKAVNCACYANGETTFKKQNALISLAIYAVDDNDLQLISLLIEKLNVISDKLTDENDVETLNDLLQILATA